jgi:polysaccharide chain length determinant protein (PEP-CTERM system associated)
VDKESNMAEGLGESFTRSTTAMWRRRRVFAWTLLATLVAVVAFTVGLPNVYRASASLLVQGQWADTVNPAPSGADGRLQTIKQEALSRARLTDLLQKFDLYGVSEGRISLERGIERLQRDIRVDATSTDQSARGGGQTLAFKVSYVSSNPKTAADVANEVASFFVAHNDQMRVHQASQATEFLAAQVAETRARLDEQQGRVRAFSSRNLGALPQQTDANIAAINRLDAQLRLNDAEQLKLVERRQSLKNDIATLQVQAPPPTDTSPQAQLARLEAEVEQLRTRFGENYPDVKSARARLEAYKREVASARPARPEADAGPSQKAVLEQALAEVDAQIKRIAAEDESVRAQITHYQNRVEQAPAQAPAFDGLMRDYQSTRDQMDTLQKRYMEAQLAERAQTGGDTQEFRVLDPAVPPTSAAGPSRIVLFGLGLVAAIMLGLAAAFVTEQADTSFHSVDDVRAFTRVPILACIPDISSPPQWTHRVRRAGVAVVGILAVGALAEGAFQLARVSDQVSRLLSRVM